MNLAYLAAYLRLNGFKVAIADYEIETYSDHAFIEVLREFKPSIVGVSCATPTIKNGDKICGLAKSFNKDIVTVVGGPHANGLPVKTLEEFHSFDYLVYGEGEITFNELCLHIKTGVPSNEIRGVVCRKNENIVKNPPRELISNLDDIPFPARDLIRYDIQSGHSARGFPNKILSTELFTSRGCPFGCTFCAIQTTFGDNVRFRESSFIEEEIRQIIRDYHFNHIVIADDTFTLNHDRAFEICGILKGNGIKSWNCDTRVTSVSKELLKAMKESGCQKIAYGVESGSQRIIDLIHKKINVERVKEAVYWAREAGIKHIEGNFIIGSDPSEGVEDIEMTRKLIMSLPWTFISVSIIVPYPGTPVYKKMQEKKLIAKDAAWEDFVMFGKIPMWRTDNFLPEDLIKMQKNLTKEFYLNPKYIFNRLMSVRSWTDINYWFGAGIAYLKWHYFGKV